jgi:hypothetical protein
MRRTAHRGIDPFLNKEAAAISRRLVHRRESATPLGRDDLLPALVDRVPALNLVW